jgi:hypothetical protein
MNEKKRKGFFMEHNIERDVYAGCWDMETFVAFMISAIT